MCDALVSRCAEEVVTLYAVSIREPWASLILKHHRDCENRRWSTVHRGPLLIHISSTTDREACGRFGIDPRTLQTGVIAGVVTLVDVVRNHKSPWAQAGAYHWLLREARPFDVPIAMPGRLKLFPVKIPARFLAP